MHVTSVQCLLSTAVTVLKLENYSHTWILPTPKATFNITKLSVAFSTSSKKKFNEHVRLFEKPAIF